MGYHIHKNSECKHDASVVSKITEIGGFYGKEVDINETIKNCGGHAFPDTTCLVRVEPYSKDELVVCNVGCV